LYIYIIPFFQTNIKDTKRYVIAPPEATLEDISLQMATPDRPACVQEYRY